MNTPTKVGRSKAAKQPKTRTTRMESWTADCYGRFWGGYDGWYEYKFVERPTREQVVSRAGDFDNLTKIRLTHIVSVTTWTEEVL